MKIKITNWDTYLLRILVIIGSMIALFFTWQAMQLTGEKQSARYFLAFEMFLGVVLLFVPSIIKRLTKLAVPRMLKVLYWLFLYLAVFIGTGFGFYGKIFYWDKFLHISSSMLLVALGLGVMSTFIPKAIQAKISPWFFVLFSFTFGLAMGVFWEFYEYTFDGLLQMNMQRFATSQGVNLVGRAALLDTMGDLGIDALGSALFAGYAGFKMKRNDDWLGQLAFIRE